MLGLKLEVPDQEQIRFLSQYNLSEPTISRDRGLNQAEKSSEKSLDVLARSRDRSLVELVRVNRLCSLEAMARIGLCGLKSVTAGVFGGLEAMRKSWSCDLEAMVRKILRPWGRRPMWPIGLHKEESGRPTANTRPFLAKLYGNEVVESLEPPMTNSRRTDYQSCNHIRIVYLSVWSIVFGSYCQDVKFGPK